jgi:hypothetical protein
MVVVATYHKRRRRYRQIFAASTHSGLEKLEFRSPSKGEKYLRIVENAT